MKKILFSLGLLFLALSSFGQETFTFRNTLSDTARVKIDYSLAGSHFLGNIIAKKLYLLKETYTYVEKGTPMSPGDKVIVRKPTIYYTVRKLNSYYKKEIKKGSLTSEEAAKQFADILDKCYVIFYQDTDAFEEYLKSHKRLEDKEKAFERIELL